VTKKAACFQAARADYRADGLRSSLFRNPAHQQKLPADAPVNPFESSF
jgi:hypothetical protein